MENSLDTGAIDAPWWLDGVAESDIFEWPERWAIADPGSSDFLPLSVEETLVAVSMVGPGSEAIRLLDSLRGQVLTEDQRLTVVQLWQAQKSWVAGAEQAAIFRFAPPPDPTDAKAVLEEEFVHLELAPALHTSTDQARARIEEARAMHGRYAATGEQLRAGVLDPYRVSLITKVLDTLPDAAAAQVEAAVLPKAASQSPSQLRRALTKASRAADEEWNARMFARTRKGRRVEFDVDAEPGLIRLTAYLPPVEGLAVQQALEAAAGKFDPADGRDHGERMCDALTACVIGAEHDDDTTDATTEASTDQQAQAGGALTGPTNARKAKSPRPVRPKVLIQVLVPVGTLMGMREDPGELRGYGDIPAEVARELAADADWQRWTYEPVNGHLIDQGKKIWRPKECLRQFLTGRDRYDRFPGSSRLAENCDAEHNQAFDQTGQGRGGSTSAAGMCMVSRPAHRAKTLADHAIRHDPDGTITWTTPLGRQYQTKPWDYRPDSDKQ